MQIFITTVILFCQMFAFDLKMCESWPILKIVRQKTLEEERVWKIRKFY